MRWRNGSRLNINTDRDEAETEELKKVKTLEMTKKWRNRKRLKKKKH